MLTPITVKAPHGTGSKNRKSINRALISRAPHPQFKSEGPRFSGALASSSGLSYTGRLVRMMRTMSAITSTAPMMIMA